MQRMRRRLGIREITKQTRGWTCKVQLIDKYGGEVPHSGLKYLNVIFQDEQEDQIKAIIYGDDLICHYEKLFNLFSTYLVNGAYVQDPYLKNDRPIHTYDWKIDIGTIIDPIEKCPGEQPLPLPTRLGITSFDEIINVTNNDPNLLLDVLAVVANCFPAKYIAALNKTAQEVLLVDIHHRKYLLLTIWDAAIMEKEGSELLRCFKEYPIILARRVGTSTYNEKSLTTKFNTTIYINPPYPQCAQLHTWVQENQQILRSFTTRSTSDVGTILFVALEDVTVPIRNIQSQKDGQSFSIEAKIILPEDLEFFHVVVCPRCELEVRPVEARVFYCIKCQEDLMLTPRCKFDVILKDSTGSTLGLIMGKVGEKMLSLTTEQIYKLAMDGPLPFDRVRKELAKKTFRVQVKKPFRSRQATPAKLYVLFCTEKEGVAIFPSPTITSTTEVQGESISKRKKDDSTISDEETAQKLNNMNCSSQNRSWSLQLQQS